MARLLTCAVILMLAIRLEPAAADTHPRIPPGLNGYFLSGEPISIPSDFQEPATLLIIGRDHPGSEGFDSWQDVATRLGGDVPCIFAVLMGERRGISRAVAAGRLRREVRDVGLQKLIVPVFQDERQIFSDLGLGVGLTALLVNGDGDVVWKKEGLADSATITEIRRILNDQPLQGSLTETPAPPIEPASANDVTAPAEPVQETSAAVPVPDVEGPADRFDALQGMTLSGDKLQLPSGLSVSGTEVLLVPEYTGTDELHSILSNLQEQAGEDWLVLVFQGDAPRFSRAFSAGQLRAAVERADWRERVVPVFEYLSEFERRSGLAPVAGLRLLRVDNTGTMLPLPCLDGFC